MSLWLKMSFQREKQSWDNLMFIYEMTLEESLLFDVFLEKVIQLGWLRAPTYCSPFSFTELGIEQMKNQGSSWMKIISKFLCTSKIVLVSSLFL